MSIVLIPPILLPDYWLICPTCVYLVTLLICSLYNLLEFAVLVQFVVVPSPVWSWSCHALPCLAMPCPALSCLAKPCLVPVFPPRVSFCCFFCFILWIKWPFTCTTESSPLPFTPILTVRTGQQRTPQRWASSFFRLPPPDCTPTPAKSTLTISISRGLTWGTSPVTSLLRCGRRKKEDAHLCGVLCWPVRTVRIGVKGRGEDSVVQVNGHFIHKIKNKKN